MQEAQQRCADLASENAKLRASSAGGAGAQRSLSGAQRRGPDPTKEPVDRLHADFANRKSTLDDDLSFIQEVVTGASTAIPDFNPEMVRACSHTTSCTFPDCDSSLLC